jgi:hypothetical protein
VAFSFIAENDRPDHDKIAAFRWLFLMEFEALFVRVLQLGRVTLNSRRSMPMPAGRSALSYGHASQIGRS